MPDLSDEARAALAYWPTIEHAAANHLPTADLWAALNGAAAELGLDSPGVTLQGVNTIRSLATQIQATSARLERTDPTYRMEGNLISEAPWGRSLAERDAMPMFQVRYQHTTVGPNGEETNWRTSTFHGQLPRTVGDLLEAIEEDAEHLADKYGHSHGGTSAHQVLSI
jgi:hypothetical protein